MPAGYGLKFEFKNLILQIEVDFFKKADFTG